MNKNKTGIKIKKTVIFEKLTVEEAKKVIGRADPDGNCTQDLGICGNGGPPTINDC